MDLDELRLYLPKYLSPETENKLFADLEMFPNNIDERMYSSIDEDTVFQGDAIQDLMVVSLPNLATTNASCLVLSNSCDIAPSNRRLYPSSVMYSPLIRLSRYTEMLADAGIQPARIDNHVTTIRKQAVSQVFYLPAFSGFEESIVFFDRIVSNQIDQVPRPIPHYRLFTLSQYGHYMLLYKMSIHFTRIAESIDRKY